MQRRNQASQWAAGREGGSRQQWRRVAGSTDRAFCNALVSNPLRKTQHSGCEDARRGRQEGMSCLIPALHPPQLTPVVPDHLRSSCARLEWLAPTIAP